MLLPAATGFGDAALVTLISALETTLATSVALSFARLISPPPDTKAVLVTVEGAVCNTFAVIVIEELLFAAMPGATQLTVWEAIEQAGRQRKRTPVGRCRSSGRLATACAAAT